MKNISNYYQPNFYSFTEESLELASFAYKYLDQKVVLENALDLCCGCGVIGIEAKSKNLCIKKMSFLELQEEFIPFLEKNLKLAECDNFEIIQNSLGKQEFPKGYFNIIFSNPPYFIPGDGRPSPNHKRQKCRSFEMDGWSLFFDKIRDWLTPGGYLFFSTKDFSQVEKNILGFKLEAKIKTSSSWLIFLSRLYED